MISISPSQLRVSSLRRATSAAVTTTTVPASFQHSLLPLLLSSHPGLRFPSQRHHRNSRPHRAFAIVSTDDLMQNSVPSRSGIYTVGDFMTRKEGLHVVKPTTTVDEALEALVEHRITGFPVIDDNWKLVGLVSDYDLLALDSISGTGQTDTSMFPEVDSTWKTFNEVQKLLSKTNGQVVGDLMTPAPLVVRESTNLEDAARLLLKTKYRRLPVVDGEGKLVRDILSSPLKLLIFFFHSCFPPSNWPKSAILKIGIITRGNVVRAALQIKRDSDEVKP